MCSIAGFITDKPLHRLTAYRLGTALLFYGADRGEQSTGVFLSGSVEKGLNGSRKTIQKEALFKKAISPNRFIEEPHFLKMFDGTATVGLFHTRQPTCGDKTRRQAQPFRGRRSVTVHNGMYWEPKELKDQWGLDKDTGVDSELVTNFIDAYGIRALPDFLESSRGMSAVAAWFGNRLYLARDSNPTALTQFTLDDKTSVTVFASTRDILENALRYIFLRDNWEIEVTNANELIHVSPSTTTKVAKWNDSGPLWTNYRDNDSEPGSPLLYDEYGEAYGATGESTRGWENWVHRKARRTYESCKTRKSHKKYDLCKNDSRDSNGSYGGKVTRLLTGAKKGKVIEDAKKETNETD